MRTFAEGATSLVGRPHAPVRGYIKASSSLCFLSFTPLDLSFSMHFAAKLFAVSSLFAAVLGAPATQSDREARQVSDPRRCGSTQDLDPEVEKIV